MKGKTYGTPLIITLFIFILFLGSVGAISKGFSEFNDSPLTGIVFVILGLLLFVIFMGLALKKQWSLYAVYALVILYFLGYNIIDSLNETLLDFSVRTFLSIILCVFLIQLLTRPKVKTYFKIDKNEG